MLPAAGPSVPTPSARMRAWLGRVSETLRSSFARPTTYLDRYLAPGENVVFVDAPSYRSFLVEQAPVLLVLVPFSLLCVWWGLESTHYMVMFGRLLLVLLVLAFLAVKRWLQLYTAYVMTTMRVMRLSGFFGRTVAWVPWAKITDIRYETTFVGRILGYSTVFIDSANEQSGLGRMRNLQHPREFYRILTEQVEQKQGNLRAQAVIVD